MKKVKKCIATLIDEKGVVIRTQFMEGEDFFMSVDPEMCKILSRALEIKSCDEIPIIISKRCYEDLLESNENWKKSKKKFFRLSLDELNRTMLTRIGNNVEWAAYEIRSFLIKYLKEHGVDENTSLTEKRIHTIAFAHALEDKLLDYIEKLEEFIND